MGARLATLLACTGELGPVSTTAEGRDHSLALTRPQNRGQLQWLLLSTAEERRPPLGQLPVSHSLQPFSQKPCTPTVTKEFQIGLCEVVEAELELFCNYWSGGFLGERLYVVHDGCTPTRKLDSRWLVGALAPLPSSRYSSSAKRRAAQSSLYLREGRDEPVEPRPQRKHDKRGPAVVFF